MLTVKYLSTVGRNVIFFLQGQEALGQSDYVTPKTKVLGFSEISGIIYQWTHVTMNNT